MLARRRLTASLSAFVLIPVLAVSVSTMSGQATAAPRSAAPGADSALFTPIDRLALGRDATVHPVSYVASRADLPGLRTALARPGKVSLDIPDPSGETTAFTLVEDSVMEPALQAAHPDIRTYQGAAADRSTIRLDVTTFGFHAMVRRPDGTAWYVDPVSRQVGEDRVVSYAGGAMPAPDRSFVERDVEQATPARGTGTTDAVAGFSTPGGAVTRRDFRLALLTDPTYAAYVAPGATTHGTSDPLVLAAKTTLINRVDEVYNDDLGIHFTLVAGTDELNLLNDAEATGDNGPCGADSCFDPGELDFCDVPPLNRMEFVLGQLVGADNYDIGHLGLGVNGGGIAYLGVVGGLNTDGTGANKGGGCTGLPDPIGDFYAIDYVAHEMGHQMGSDHTFNGRVGNCAGGNRDSTPFDIQVEPGSGSSVMAYAGICGSDDLQPHSDPYFSYASNDVINAVTATTPTTLDEIQSVNLSGFGGSDSFTLTCAGCGTSGTVVNGTSYTKAGLQAAVLAATGEAATVKGYDGGALDTDGFTASWPASVGDVPTLVVTPVSGTFGHFTGTTRNGGPTTNGGTTTVTADHAPVVTAPEDKTIPQRTPFTLTGSGSDPDGDPLTYMWEQADPGGATGTGLVSNNKLNGPLFRQFGVAAQVSDVDTLKYHSPGENLAGTSPSRTFPDLAQVVGGVTNAATGACPAAPTSGAIPQTTVDCFSEFLPTASWVGDPAERRVMHFRLTARDEFLADGAADHAGGSSFDSVALTVDPATGPFLVTSRALAGTPTAGGRAEAVTWDVNGTAAAALAPTVRISLSTDGGVTFPTVLADNTPNDGTEVVGLPTITTQTTRARIKVEAVGNYFFDVNDADFTIDPGVAVPPPVADVHLGDGKGKYTSPEHSAKKHPNASGRTKLKFTVSTSGATGTPFGKAKLKFIAGNVRFKGDDVTTAIVSGSVLTMKVDGKDHGKSGYTLVVVAKDGSKDKVRVRLLKGSKVVYDSSPGRKASAKPKTKFRGDIVVG